VCERCTAAGLNKATGIAVRDEYEDSRERLVDCMELVGIFDRDKLFVFVNLQSFFSNHEMELFLSTVSGHG